MLSGIQLYASPGVGCQFPLQGIFPPQGSSPVSPALAGRFFFTTEPLGKPITTHWLLHPAKSLSSLDDI